MTGILPDSLTGHLLPEGEGNEAPPLSRSGPRAPLPTGEGRGEGSRADRVPAPARFYRRPSATFFCVWRIVKD